MKDFFISYNHKDRQWAEWIAWVLEEEGYYSTIMQAWDFRPGCNFPLEMDKAVKEAERTILVLSPDFLNSGFTASEFAAAFVQDPIGNKGKLLPIKIRDCRPEGLLSPINRIDLIGLDENEAKKVLLAGVSYKRAKPKSCPTFPGVRSVADQPRFPGELPKRGDLPPGHRMLFSPNVIFTGRQQQLKDIADILLDISKEGAGVVVTGIGGVGKSQLAVELCYRFGRFFGGVHWIQANLNLSAEIADCGRAMGLPSWPDKLPEQVAATLRAWQQGNMHLIVLDNTADLKQLQEWMPKLQSCRLLITSRREKWPADLALQVLRLNELSRIQSTELLRKLAPRLQRGLDEDLDALAQYLGDLPLALDLAGRYLEERTELSIKEYLVELEEAGNALEHTSLKDWVETNPTNHPTSLAATFALSWDQLVEADELARLLFRMSGYCAPNMPIPRQLLAAAIGTKRSAPEFDKALRKLESLGLLQPTESGHRIHTMLAEFAHLQDRDAKESALPALANVTIALTNQVLESHLPERMDPLREHLVVVAKAAELAVDWSAGALWNNYGLHLNDLADFGSAKTSLKKALHLDEKIYGPNHPNIAIRMSNLGGILQELGELQEAKKLFERAIQIDEKVYGPDHPNMAIRANNLGGILQELGELQKAKKLFERAIQIDEKVYGPDHPNLARDVNNLGLIMLELGELQDARKLFERSMQIDEKIYGPNHPNMAIRANNLGGTLQELGELQKAKKLLKRAIQIDEKVYGPDHPKVASRLNNLGGILLKLGELQEAKKLFERAIQIDEKIYGLYHPDVAREINNLGMVLLELGDPLEAKKFLEKATQIDEKVYGLDHSNVARDANNLGMLMLKLGELQEAKKLFKRAIQIDEKVYGPDHPNVATDINNLGMVLQDLDELLEAKKLFERAIQIDEKVYGPDHPNVAREINNLGSVLMDLREPLNASKCFERALVISKHKLGEGHPTTKLIWLNLNCSTLEPSHQRLRAARQNRFIRS